MRRGKSFLVFGAALFAATFAAAYVAFRPQPVSEDEQMFSGLHYGQIGAVRAALSFGANPNATDETGIRALVIAAEKSDNGSVAALFGAGANPNATDPRGYTALMVAAHLGKKSAVEALIGQDADVNARRPNGETALRLALERKQEHIVALLRKAGAKE
jgi:ankyrin repeat protein